MHIVQAWIEKIGLTQEDFAAKVGVTQSFLSQIFNGKRKPGYKTTASIEKITGIPRAKLRPDIYGRMA